MRKARDISTDAHLPPRLSRFIQDLVASLTQITSSLLNQQPPLAREGEGASVRLSN